MGYKKLIKEIYEGGNTLRNVKLPIGTTMQMVADYIAENYVDYNGRPERYYDDECWSDENIYYWINGFTARIDIWTSQITIWKE